MSPLGFDREGEPRRDMIIRVLMVLVIVISLPAISTLQLPPKAIAQAPSEGVKLSIMILQPTNSHCQKKRLNI
jgi:hypothetical protein